MPTCIFYLTDQACRKGDWCHKHVDITNIACPGCKETYRDVPQRYDWGYVDAEENWFPNWESNAHVRQSTLASSSYQQQPVSSSQEQTSQSYYESPRPQYYTPPPVSASDPRYNYSSSQAPVTSSSYYSSSHAPPSRDRGGPRYQGPSMLDPPNRARSQVLPTRSAYQEPKPTSGDCDSCQKEHGSCDRSRPSCSRCARKQYRSCTYTLRAAKTLATRGSCDECLLRHGKCDRGSPCARCVRENKKCVYDERRALPPRRIIGPPESPRWVKEARMR